jgi:hypothetical protein
MTKDIVKDIALGMHKTSSTTMFFISSRDFLYSLLKTRCAFVSKWTTVLKYGPTNEPHDTCSICTFAHRRGENHIPYK